MNAEREGQRGAARLARAELDKVTTKTFPPKEPAWARLWFISEGNGAENELRAAIGAADAAGLDALARS